MKSRSTRHKSAAEASPSTPPIVFPPGTASFSPAPVSFAAAAAAVGSSPVPQAPAPPVLFAAAAPTSSRPSPSSTASGAVHHRDDCGDAVGRAPAASKQPPPPPPGWESFEKVAPSSSAASCLDAPTPARAEPPHSPPGAGFESVRAEGPIHPLFGTAVASEGTPTLFGAADRATAQPDAPPEPPTGYSAAQPMQGSSPGLFTTAAFPASPSHNPADAPALFGRGHQLPSRSQLPKRDARREGARRAFRSGPGQQPAPQQQQQQEPAQPFSAGFDFSQFAASVQSPVPGKPVGDASRPSARSKLNPFASPTTPGFQPFGSLGQGLDQSTAGGATPKLFGAMAAESPKTPTLFGAAGSTKKQGHSKQPFPVHLFSPATSGPSPLAARAVERSSSAGVAGSPADSLSGWPSAGGAGSTAGDEAATPSPAASASSNRTASDFGTPKCGYSFVFGSAAGADSPAAATPQLRAEPRSALKHRSFHKNPKRKATGVKSVKWSEGLGAFSPGVGMHETGPAGYGVNSPVTSNAEMFGAEPATRPGPATNASAGGIFGSAHSATPGPFTMASPVQPSATPFVSFQFPNPSPPLPPFGTSTSKKVNSHPGQAEAPPAAESLVQPSAAPFVSFQFPNPSPPLPPFQASPHPGQAEASPAAESLVDAGYLSDDQATSLGGKGSGSDDSAAAGQAAEAGPGGPEGARFPSAAGRDGSAVSSPAMEPDPAHSTECSTDSLGTEGGSEVGEEANAEPAVPTEGVEPGELPAEEDAADWTGAAAADSSLPEDWCDARDFAREEEQEQEDGEVDGEVDVDGDAGGDDPETFFLKTFGNPLYDIPPEGESSHELPRQQQQQHQQQQRSASDVNTKGGAPSEGAARPNLRAWAPPPSPSQPAAVHGSGDTSRASGHATSDGGQPSIAEAFAAAFLSGTFGAAQRQPPPRVAVAARTPADQSTPVSSPACAASRSQAAGAGARTSSSSPTPIPQKQFVFGTPPTTAPEGLPTDDGNLQPPSPTFMFGAGRQTTPRNPFARSSSRKAAFSGATATPPTSPMLRTFQPRYPTPHSQGSSDDARSPTASSYATAPEHSGMSWEGGEGGSPEAPPDPATRTPPSVTSATFTPGSGRRRSRKNAEARRRGANIQATPEMQDVIRQFKEQISLEGATPAASQAPALSSQEEMQRIVEDFKARVGVSTTPSPFSPPASPISEHAPAPAAGQSTAQRRTVAHPSRLSREKSAPIFSAVKAAPPPVAPALSRIPSADLNGILMRRHSTGEDALSAMDQLNWRMCDDLRVQGNRAFANQSYQTAVKTYTQALQKADALTSELQVGQKQTVAKILANRAAANLMMCADDPSTGASMVAKARADCSLALQQDPTYSRAHVRLAGCLLKTGHFAQSLSVLSAMSEQTQEAADMREDVLKASTAWDQGTGLLASAQLSTCADARAETTSAMQAIRVVARFAPLARFLPETTAKIHIVLGEFKESLKVIERASGAQSARDVVAGSEDLEPPANWEAWYKVQATYGSGDLEQASSLLDACLLTEDSFQAEKQAMQTVIRLQLAHKLAGNDAFKNGLYEAAVSAYTEAAEASGASLARAFNAVCYCNRAAALHALLRYADALADCARAVVLRPAYHKALSRRAELYLEVRDFEAAAEDLQRMLTLLAELSNGGTETRAFCEGLEREREVRARLERARTAAAVEQGRARRGAAAGAVHYYRLLGVPETASAGEIKKAYRQLALRHHPDKVASSVACADHQQREQLVTEAERLFKMIGRSMNVLADAKERRRFDQEDLHRNPLDSMHSSYSRFRSRSNGFPTARGQPEHYYDFYDHYTSNAAGNQGGGWPNTHSSGSGFAHQQQRHHNPHFTHSASEGFGFNPQGRAHFKQNRNPNGQ